MTITASGSVSTGGSRGGDVAIGALAALIYVGEYLGQGAIANKAFNTGSVTALTTAALGTILVLWFSTRRNPLTGPRFLSVVCYASILDYATTIPALKTGGALLAFMVTSICVSVSGLWLLVVCRWGLEGRLRALMSVPALSALAFIVAATTIAGQVTDLNKCVGDIAWPALAVAGTVVALAFGMKYTLRTGNMLYRARLCVAMIVAGALYFGWRSVSPTPALCSSIGQIQGAELSDALLGAWRWPSESLSALAHPTVLLTVFLGSVALALLCLIDTVSAASSLASDEGHPDADNKRELLSTAWGNVVFGVMGLLPIALSLSRSRTVAELKPLGSKLPALSHALALLLLLVCLVPLQWPLLDYLPKAAIAGALMVVSIEMLDDKSVLLWRAALGAPAPRLTVAGSAWVFLLALTVAVLLTVGPYAKFGVTLAFGTAIAASLVGLGWSPNVDIPAHTIFAGRLHFLNIGLRLRLWKQMGIGHVDLSATTHVDFTAACALADLARTNPGMLTFVLGADTGTQVRQVLEVCCPSRMEIFQA